MKATIQPHLRERIIPTPPRERKKGEHNDGKKHAEREWRDRERADYRSPD
jgi:hypothetical protein